MIQSLDKGYHLHRKNRIVFFIFCIGFIVGTVSHTTDILNLGFLGYTFAPFALNVFWTSLVFLDPLVILLLFLNLRIAILLAIIVMVFDITINLTYGIVASHTPILLGLVTQIPFGIFVGFTAKELFHYKTWKEFLKLEPTGSRIE